LSGCSNRRLWHHSSGRQFVSFAYLKILVTGSSTSFAQALLPVLCEQTAVDAVTGIDLRAPRFAHAKFRHTALALRDAGVGELLRTHDALVHLASVVLPADMNAEQMFDVNVRAAHRLFHEARAEGLKRLVHLSSATVYGEAIHAAEQTPLKPIAGFLYAEHQARLEKLLAIDFPDCVRLRPALIVGPRAHAAVKRMFRQPFYLSLPEPQPLIQCVHENDLAQAVLLCLTGDAAGPYNVAAEDSFSMRDALRARHRLSFGLPLWAARLVLKAAGRIGRWGADPGLLQACENTTLINSRRAIVDLGWRATYSARAALESM
jgi:UDP-glucose 4-epimerase